MKNQYSEVDSCPQSKQKLKHFCSIQKYIRLPLYKAWPAFTPHLKNPLLVEMNEDNRRILEVIKGGQKTDNP